MKHVHHEEIEYDIELRYRRMRLGKEPCPFNVGDEVKSPVRDDVSIFHFIGQAFVVHIEIDSEDGARVFLKQYYNRPW